MENQINNKEFLLHLDSHTPSIFCKLKSCGGVEYVEHRLSLFPKHYHSGDTDRKKCLGNDEIPHGSSCVFYLF